MRASSIILSVLFIVILICQFPSIQSLNSVIGIDFGSEFIKIGFVKVGTPIDVVLNEQAKRKTSNMIGFRDNERYFGYNSDVKFSRFPKMNFKFLNLVLGQEYNKSKESFERLKSIYVPTRFLENSRGGIDVYLPDLKQAFSLEELVAQIFRYIKSLSTAHLGEEVNDAVIAIPVFYTQQQRNALRDAAQIAGINILGWMQDTTAVALQYGISKYLGSTEPQNILFFDLGSSSLQVSVVSYEPRGKDQQDILGKFKVKGIAWDYTVGSVDFDAVLARHFAELFKKEHGMDVTKNHKAMAKIMITAKKIKEVLSANTETIAQLEGVVDDLDLYTKITRAEFIQMSKPLLDKILPVVHKAIERSGIAAKDIHAFELIGGGSRVPEIQSMLKKEFNRGLNFSLNSDEALCLGAAFQAAVKTPTRLVRTFQFDDAFPFAVDFTVDQDSTRRPLFKPLDAIETTRTITLQRDKPFSIELHYGNDPYPRTGQALVEYKFSGVAEALEKLKPEENATKVSKSIKVSFTLSDGGFIDLKSATAVMERTIIIPPKNETPAGPQKPGKKVKKPKAKRQKKVSSENLIVEKIIKHLPPMTEEQILAAQQRLNKLDERDLERKIRAERRNDLESYVYSCKNQLAEEEVKPFYTEAEATQLSKLIEENQEWLDIQGDDAQLTDYESRLEALRKIWEPIAYRMDQLEKRARQIVLCKNIFNGTRVLVEKFEKDFPQITKEEREQLLKLVETVENWLEEKLRLQNKSALHEPPVVTADEIHEKCQTLTQRALVLAQRPPLPKEEKTTNQTDTKEPPKEGQTETQTDKTPKEEQNETKVEQNEAKEEQKETKVEQKEKEEQKQPPKKDEL